MRLLGAVLLLISSNLNAKISHLTCSKSGLHIAFINGVGVDIEQFDTFRKQSIQLGDEVDSSLVDLSPPLGGDKINYEAYHNSSTQVLYDGLEAWKLYMDGQTTEDGGFFSEDTIA